ncbi:MAG TPA: RES family NAD+ phosphorylase [Rhizomicrobium sp.]|nr:RES family NAD+ phosphorylase [Rhizomicrobium sp.]
MSHTGRVHDRAILDALEDRASEAFRGNVWRVTRAGVDPLRGSNASGRWSPSGEFVLYTSCERDGAIEEIGYRLSLEPVWPSRLKHELHELGASTKRTLRFADVAALEPFGVNAARYGSFAYEATQAIAAAAHFLGFDGLLVPNARFPCSNLVVFVGDTKPSLTPKKSETIDWTAWRKKKGLI